MKTQVAVAELLQVTRHERFRRSDYSKQAISQQKPNLPEKICVSCGRVFRWRRKWAKVWAED
ncbi:DUF2256 domain-containing protein [Allorhodopirellula heiligendammensis]|uniref:DUF2256 domain-containing protein n=1 Tax=Allorhodopirellula heiligendammensis TaxID=2714739 RepID=UPI00345E5086